MDLSTLFQQLIPFALGVTSDLSVYKENQEILYDGLTKLGYEVVKPQGAFYLFVKALEEDATKLLEKVIKQFTKSVTEYAEIEKGKKEVNFNGEKVKAKTVDVKMDGAQLAEVIYEVAEFLYESKDMEALLEDYTDLIVTYMAATGEEIEADDMIDAVYEALDGILDNIDDVSDEMEDIEFNVVAYLNSGCLIGMDFAMEEDSEEMAVSVMAGPTLADMKEFRVTIEEYGTKTTLVYAVDANDSKEYEANSNTASD